MLKINDKVIQVDRPELGVGVILGITYDPDTLYSIDFPFLRCTRRECQLKLYKEMKEERNITLTLDKAKEWYKKGGELKEIALQAFNEKELTPLPRSWEEFCDNYMIDDSEAFFDTCSEVCIADKTCRHSLYDRNMCPSKKSAEAHLAMIQIEQLRNCWWNGWEPEWNTSHKYCIKNVQGEITTLICSSVAAFLVFPTMEMAEEFLKCFRDLIEKAGDLI